MRSLAIVFAMTVCAVIAAAAPLERSRQCLIVTTDSWESASGTMSMFERNATSSWRPTGSTISVVVGRAGLAWGRGLIETSGLSGPVKKEGDYKAPAGVFKLGSVFGLKRETKMPFVAITENVVAVDDPHSRYYNRLVDGSEIRRRDWKHAEKMFGVDVYKCGVFVEHNIPPKPGAGSCIFLHIWQNRATSTSGCTAMAEENLRIIIRWLDPAKHPVLVQLPRPAYENLRDKWNLPRSATF